MGKDASCTGLMTEFNPWNSHRGGRKKDLVGLSSDLYMCVIECMPACTQTDRDRHTDTDTQADT